MCKIVSELILPYYFLTFKIFCMCMCIYLYVVCMSVCICVFMCTYAFVHEYVEN